MFSDPFPHSVAKRGELASLKQLLFLRSNHAMGTRKTKGLDLYRNTPNHQIIKSMKRYCQTLDLYNDPELISAYVTEHKHVWDEIKEGIRSVGILDMQIYLHGNRLFMIMDTTDEFDWEKDNARLAELPRQAEWEAHMSRFQVSEPGQASHRKWRLMAPIFSLNG